VPAISPSRMCVTTSVSTSSRVAMTRCKSRQHQQQSSRLTAVVSVSSGRQRQQQSSAVHTSARKSRLTTRYGLMMFRITTERKDAMSG
jgi:hypothetical protein